MNTLFLQTIPDEHLETHQLSSIILEYRRECGSSDIVQSLCQPDENWTNDEEGHYMNLMNGFNLASEILEGRGLSGFLDNTPTRYTHLLQIKGEKKKEEIVRGRTTWRKRSNACINGSG